jgi:preprotein translocase subunit SecA
MAGRGTDIKLGGNTEGLASEILHKRGLNPAEVDAATMDEAIAEAKAVVDVDHETVVAAGGLHIIGTERHESRRIDNQLRGRAARQGDPGSSRFYLSLDDDLMKRFASDRVAGLMERMGLEDDVAIESKLVSRTIESAQSRVEGFNFDIRKRVVEFDDVINKQRETIYAERDKVLRNEDLTETVREFLDAEMEELADQYIGDPSPSEWNLEGLSAALQAMGIDGPGTSEADLDEVATTHEEGLEHLRQLADDRLTERGQEHGEEVWSQVKRFVLLRTIDSLWVEHLTEVDDMRRGIGLRGYAQQDPLNEFRKEAYRLYEELSGLIRRQVATTIFRVTVKQEPATVPLSGPGQPARPLGAPVGDGTATNGSNGSNGATGAPATAGIAQAAAPAALAAGGAALRRPETAPMTGLPADPMLGARTAPGASGASGSVRPGFTPSGARIGRNDPCWCGSGQKYKKCHGA